jgi:hypothetical protein
MIQLNRYLKQYPKRAIVLGRAKELQFSLMLMPLTAITSTANQLRDASGSSLVPRYNRRLESRLLWHHPLLLLNGALWTNQPEMQCGLLSWPMN